VRPEGSGDGRLVDMRFCKSVAVVLLGLLGFGCAVAARAQAGVYVGFQATQLSGIQCFDISPLKCGNGTNGALPSTTTPGAYTYSEGDLNPQGVQAGAYYDFRNVGPMRLGIDFRGGTQHSNKSATSSAGGKDTTGFDNVLLGVRGSFHTRFSWLVPYAQISAGYARSNATLPIGSGLVTTVPLPRTEDNFLMYEGFVGVTVPIFPMIDLRPIELGIGNMNRFGNSSGTLDGPSSIGVKSIGASVVFHMPSK
jgi:hypothetical protein